MLRVGRVLAVVAATALTPSFFGLQNDITIRSTVQEVVLDLVVRDSRGRQVKGLQQGDVTVLEDGVPQPIRSFRMVTGKEVIQQTAMLNATTPAKPAASALPAVNLVCLVFQNLDPFTKKYAVEAAQEFLKNNFQQDTWLTAFILDSKLTPLHGFTQNRGEVMQAAQNAYTSQGIDFMNVADAVINASPNSTSIETAVVGNPAAGGTETSALNITGGEINTRAINDASVSNDIGSNQARGEKASARRNFSNIEGRRSMDQIDIMIKQLATLPGRKTVLLLSPGLPTNGDPDQFQSIISKANKADVSFYAIDTNGLAENSNALAGSAALGHAAAVSASQAGTTQNAQANMEKMRQGDTVIDAVRNTDTRATLRALSEGTGGFLIADTNDLRKPLQKILEDVDTHYEVVYKPVSDKYNGRLRNIEVKLAHADLSVESRTGYYAMPALAGSSALNAYEMTGLAALNIKTRPHAFEVRAATFEFWPKRALAIEIPAAAFSAVALPNVQKHRLQVSVLSLIKDSTGQVVDKFSQYGAIEIGDDKLNLLQRGNIPFSHPLDLPAGHYTVETAVVDEENKHASVNSMEFDNPERKGFGLSSVVLVQRLEPVNGPGDAADPFQFQSGEAQRKKVVPSLSRTVSAEAHPYVYFVVYPDKANAEKPKIQVEFLAGGQVLAKQVADLPAPDATGAIPMVVATAAQPGDCEVRITALQGAASMTQSVSYSVAAKAVKN